MTPKTRLDKLEAAVMPPADCTVAYQDPDTGLYKITVHDDNGTHEELVTLEELRRLRDPLKSNSILILVHYGQADDPGT